MSHDSIDTHAEKPTQGIFIGWLAIGLLVVMAAFALTLIYAGWTYGFQ